MVLTFRSPVEALHGERFPFHIRCIRWEAVNVSDIDQLRPRHINTDGARERHHRKFVFRDGGEAGKITGGRCISRRGGEGLRRLSFKPESGERPAFPLDGKHRPSPFLVASDDGHFLFDIEHDRILKLNAVGSEVWTLLRAGESESRIVDAITRKYQVSPDRVAADVRTLLVKIRDLGIEPVSPVSPEKTQPQPRTSHPSFPWYGQPITFKPAPTVLSVLAAILGLAIFDLVLWLFSLKSLCRCVEAWPVRKRKFNSDTAGKICSAVECATVWYPKRVVCFQRSAVTTCLLRAYGISARMKIGIRSTPLFVHSWVEVSDGVLNDWRPVTSFYKTAVSY